MLPKLTFALAMIVALQRGGGGGQGMSPPMSGGPTQFEQFVSKLKLDEKKQVPEVQQIFTSAAADASVFEREMMRQRMRMIEVIGDEAELAKVVQAYSAAAAKMTAIEVRAFDEVRALLKPGQLSRSVDAFSIMAGIFHPPTPRAGSSMGRPSRGGEPLLAAAGAGAAQAIQRGGGTGTGGGRGGGGGRGMRGGMGMGTAPTRQVAFVAMFSLSEAQKKQAKDILDYEYRAAAPLRDELAKTREAIGLAIRDEQGPSVIDQAVSEYARPVAGMAAAEMKALAKVIAVLGPDEQPSSPIVQAAAYLMRGAFIGKKWDTAPDARFY